MVAQLDTFYLLAYIGPLMLPFIYLVLMPKLWNRLKGICLRERRLAVAPVTVTLQRRQRSHHRRVPDLTNPV